MIFKHGILLIEDSAEAAKATTAAFRESGFLNPISAFDSAKKAIGHLEAMIGDEGREPGTTPCFILLSLEVRDMPAIEFLNWLRGHRLLKKMPVVAFASNEDVELFHQAYDAGANSCLVKPLSQPELMKVIKAINGYWVILVEKPLL